MTPYQSLFVAFIVLAIAVGLGIIIWFSVEIISIRRKLRIYDQKVRDARFNHLYATVMLNKAMLDQVLFKLLDTTSDSNKIKKTMDPGLLPKDDGWRIVSRTHPDADGWQ